MGSQWSSASVVSLKGDLLNVYLKKNTQLLVEFMLVQESLFILRALDRAATLFIIDKLQIIFQSKPPKILTFKKLEPPNV